MQFNYKICVNNGKKIEEMKNNYNLMCKLIRNL